MKAWRKNKEILRSSTDWIDFGGTIHFIAAGYLLVWLQVYFQFSFSGLQTLESEEPNKTF